MAFMRLFAACVSTAEMIHLERYSAFTERYPGWVFTLGLSLSSAVDIIITAWLCYFLRAIRRSAASTTMIHVVDTLTLYTLENGSLTCVATTASLICWLTMPRNLVFLGLHFVIGKLYANSLLASLNTRKELREMRSYASPEDRERAMPVLSAEDFNPYHARGDPYTIMSPLHAYRPGYKSRKTEVSVERTVERTSDDLDDLPRIHSRAYRPRSPTVLQWRSLP